jgi:cell division inhibitor SulA/protein ImuA
VSAEARRRNLDALLADPRLWRGGGHSAAARIPSDHPQLDAALGGGWPRGAVCELALAASGCGELALLLPVLRQLEGTIALIAPPHVPYPPTFAAAGVALARLLLIHPADSDQAQWAAEQTLRGGACAAVLLWLPSISTRAVRRLQLAAEAGDAFMALLLPQTGSPAHSPAALRVQLDPAPRGVAVRVRKRRGGWPGPALIVENPSRALAGPGVTALAAGGPADSD